MKKYLSALLCAVLLLALAACGKTEDAVPSFTAASETTAAPTETTVSPAEASLSEEAFSFAELEYTTFRFSSGAGGWQTELRIEPDGSFQGAFYDSNMGITEEAYPNGSVSLSNFTGRFGQPEKVHDHMYSLKLEEIRYEVQPGTQEIRDGVQYCYVRAFGLEDVETLLLYLPGVPLEELPEDFIIWANLTYSEETALPFYGLYDPETGNGFSSSSILEDIRSRVETAELEEAQIDIRLQADQTQSGMNIAAAERYALWDGVLNELWAVLQQTLEEETMRQLTNEELAWIKEKEAAVAEAGAEVEGGSLYPTVTGEAAAKITKERVYELLEYLPA